MSRTIQNLLVWNKPLIDTCQYCSTSRANQALRSLANEGFQNRGFVKRFLPSSPLPPLSFLALVSFLVRPKPKIPLLGLSLLRNQTETLATQARRFIETLFPVETIYLWDRLRFLSGQWVQLKRMQALRLKGQELKYFGFLLVVWIICPNGLARILNKVRRVRKRGNLRPTGKECQTSHGNEKYWSATIKKADVTKIEVPAKGLGFQPPSHQNPHLKSHHA